MSRYVVNHVTVTVASCLCCVVSLSLCLSVSLVLCFSCHSLLTLFQVNKRKQPPDLFPYPQQIEGRIPVPLSLCGFTCLPKRPPSIPDMTVTQNFLISTSWKRKILNLDTKANTIHNSFSWINIGTVTSRSLQRRLLALSRKLKKTILFLLVSRLKHWHDTRSHASQCTTFPPPYLPAHTSRLLTTIMFQAFLTSLYSTFCAKELEHPLPCSHKPTTGPYPEPLESIFRLVLWIVDCCCSSKPNKIRNPTPLGLLVGLTWIFCHVI